MSSTKFKVKQVKNDSETGLETFVELPIDQEDTARLMPSHDGAIDIGSGTINWRNAYLSEVTCGTLNPSGGTLNISGTLSMSSGSSSVIENRTFTPPSGVNDLEFRSVNNMYVTLDTDESGSDAFFRVRKVDTSNGGSYSTSFEINEHGNLTATGDIDAVDLSLSGDIDAVDLSLSGDISLEGKIETSFGNQDPLVIDAQGVVISGKELGTSSLTLRDASNSKTSISLIESTDEDNPGLFGQEDSFGFKLEYAGDTADNSLKLTSGYGTYTADVFTVKRDNGANTPNNDIVFKGVVECDPTTNYEGGFRSAHYGGSVGNPNLVYFSTESSNGHFNVNTSDTDTFTLYGPRGTNGKLKIHAEDLELYADADIFIPDLTEADLNSSTGYRLLGVNSSGKLYKGDADSSLELNNAFTGTHIYKSQEDLPLGSSVSLTAAALALTTSASQANCVGIVQRKVQATEEEPITTSLGEVITSGNAYYVAAVGDSIKGDLQGFKVCNEGGEIAAGDLLVTSSVSGRLMKQADDVIRASTVGKAMQAVTFNDQGQADDVYGFLYCG
tara:strand:- start:697 stop:2367 length:1671 start_codon:yes stop_codon:yes gene_type:complete